MALYDSAWCYQKCLDIADRPATDEGMTEQRWRRYLADGEQAVHETLATHVPEALYGDWTELTATTDNNGDKIFAIGYEPVGEIILCATRHSRPMRTGPEWVPQTEYLLEGNTIRLPSRDKDRSFSDGPWLKAIQPITVATPDAWTPTLTPERCRMLIPYEAAVLYASQGGLRNPAYYRDLYDEVWFGDPRRGRIGLLDSLKKQYQNNYGGGDEAKWYRSSDLGSS